MSPYLVPRIVFLLGWTTLCVGSVFPASAFSCSERTSRLVTYYALTEQDREELRRQRESWARRPRNTSGRGPGQYDDQLGGHQAPEVYVARTPVEGIEPLILSMEVEETGTGSYDILVGRPAYGDCLVYRIALEDETVATGTGTETVELPELVRIPDLVRRVYNIYQIAIPGDTWIPIIRDKTGHWLALPPPNAEDLRETGTGTASATATSTGTGPCLPISVQETDLRCEGTLLNLYRRTVILNVDQTTRCLAKYELPYVFVKTVACGMDCCETGTGTSTSSGTFGTATGSPDCNCRYYPSFFTMQVLGFSTGLNFDGNWLLTHVSKCVYYGTLGSATAILTIQSYGFGFGELFTLTLTNGTTTVVYEGNIVNDDCCVDVVTGYISGGVFPHPSTIKLVPHCETGTGTGSTGTGTATATGTFGTASASIDTGTATHAGTGTGGSGGGCPCKTFPTAAYATLSGIGCLNGLTLALASQGPLFLLGRQDGLCAGTPGAPHFLTAFISCNFDGTLTLGMDCDGVSGPRFTVGCPTPFTIGPLSIPLTCDTPLQYYDVTFTT